MDAFVKNPCLLDPKWFAHVKRFPTIDDLLGEDSLADATLHANKIDVDNIDAEMGNTFIHRSVKKRMQQKLADIEEVSAA